MIYVMLGWNQGQVLLHVRQHPLSLTSVKVKRAMGKPTKYLKAVIVLDVETKCWHHIQNTFVYEKHTSLRKKAKGQTIRKSSYLNVALHETEIFGTKQFWVAVIC